MYSTLVGSSFVPDCPCACSDKDCFLSSSSVQGYLIYVDSNPEAFLDEKTLSLSKLPMYALCVCERDIFRQAASYLYIKIILI